MKRELDLIREILLEVERHDQPQKPFRVEAVGYAPDQIAYHVKLLAEAGYLEAVDLSTHHDLDWRPRALTWQGHEFLDATRSASIWRQIQVVLKDRALSAPLSVIQDLATKLVASSLGLGS
jgi:hypothetical protein